MEEKQYAATCGTCISHNGRCLERRSRYCGRVRNPQRQACEHYHRRLVIVRLPHIGDGLEKPEKEEQWPMR